MFAQVIQGRTSDAQGLRSAMEQWTRELAPGSTGWLGSTGGVTDDTVHRRGAVRVRRRRGQELPPARADALVGGDATTARRRGHVPRQRGRDPSTCPAIRAGPAFVNVMQGHVTDAARAKELMAQMPSEDMAAYRPEILGSMAIGSPDGDWTQVLYFTSEAEAREGERKETPPEMQAVMDEMMTISTGAPDFFDLRQPIPQSPN